MAPTVVTPRASSPKATVAAVAAASATRALGKRGAMRSPTRMNAVTPRPRTRWSGLTPAISWARDHSASGIGPGGEGSPISAGA